MFLLIVFASFYQIDLCGFNKENMAPILPFIFLHNLTYFSKVDVVYVSIAH